jgi:hypothetical protein
MLANSTSEAASALAGVAFMMYFTMPPTGRMDWVGAYGQSDGEALAGGW